jgi:hypothetical protein
VDDVDQKPDALIECVASLRSCGVAVEKMSPIQVKRHIPKDHHS